MTVVAPNVLIAENDDVARLRLFLAENVARHIFRQHRMAGAHLRPITLHECRQTFASLMIAAGVNPKALQTFMGHSSITVTLDRYGHLFPGSEGEAAVLLDAYLAESHERARSASPSESDCGEVVGKSDPSRSGLDRP